MDEECSTFSLSLHPLADSIMIRFSKIHGQDVEREMAVQAIFSVQYVRSWERTHTNARMCSKPLDHDSLTSFIIRDMRVF